MSNLVAEEDDVEQNPSSKEENKTLSASAMFLYLRELFFLFALVFTSYAALFNSLPKIGKPPSPVPFFSRNSVVSDHYRGTVNLAFQKASEVDLTIIMYYAPWDAESQAARSEFEAAAEFLHDEVYFTAISCWAPNTECKQHIPKIKHFPVIVAYPQHNKGIQYKGLITSVHIIHFVRTLMRPIHRLNTPLDIVHLISEHDAVVVGSFLFSGNLGGPGYYTFYSAAMKMLEKDPYNDIAFAVTTDRDMAASIEVELVPSVRLYLWNETYEYPADVEYVDESLVKWVWQKIHQVVVWVSPPGVKSRTLSPYLTGGPTLVLFTPRNPLLGVNPMYSLVKEISLRYYNCNNSSWVTNLSKYIEMKNRGLQSRKQRLEHKCAKMRRDEKERYKAAVMTSSVVVQQVIMNSSECEKRETEEDVCDAGEAEAKFWGPQLEVCTRRFKLNSNLHSNHSRKAYSYETSMLKTAGDEKAPEHLTKAWEHERCRVMEAGNKYHRQTHPKLSRDQSHMAIDGLACSNNRTLSVIAMDSLLYYQFIEGLGLNILQTRDKTALAIIDKQAESQYAFKEVVTKNSIVEFVKNHTRGGLERTLRSTHDAHLRTLNRYRYPILSGDNCKHTDTESCVPELNSKNFMNVVMSQTKAVIVLYHTPYCALCRSISHLFLLLSRYFRHFPGLQFARIDGDNNDLPWEYTMDVYPTILFFPTLKKSESRVYSSDLPFTIRNLIHFTLANLEPEAKIPAMVSLCVSFEKLQDEHEARKCKSKVQKETYENMSKALKDMRVTIHRWKNISPSSTFSSEIRKRRKLLIRKLDYFKRIHILLGSVDRIRQDSSIFVDIVDLYNRFLSMMVSHVNSSNDDGYR